MEATRTQVGDSAARAGDRSRLGTLIAGCIAIAIAMAVPGITPNLNGILAAKLHASGADLQWIGDAGFLGAVAAAYLFGSLGDRFGRRRVLIAGAGLICVGEIVSGASTTLHLMWAGQAIAGIGFGGLGAVSLAVVMAAARTPGERVRHLAAFSGSLTIGPIASSLIGGLFGQSGEYTWAYIVTGIVAGLGGIAIAILCAESRQDPPRKLDAGGQLALIVGLCALLWGVIEGAATHWGRTPIIIAFVIAALSIATFVIIERRAGGMIDLAMFTRVNFSAAAVVAVISGFAFVGVNYIYALRATIGQGHTPLWSAWGLIISASIAGIVGFASRHALTRRFGVRWLVTVGFLCFAADAFWLRALPISDHAFAPLIPPLLLGGIAQAMTIAGMSAAAVGSVGPDEESVAASTQGVMRQLGPPLGVAIIGAIVFSSAASALAGRIGRLGLSAPVAHLAAAVNHQAGAVGVIGSGLGLKVPPLGGAAVQSLGHGLDTAALVAAIISLVTAVLSFAALRGLEARRTAPGSYADAPPVGTGVASIPVTSASAAGAVDERIRS